MFKGKVSKKFTYFKTQKGATTILLAFFVMNVLLITSLTAANVMVFNIKMSADIANSIPAYYAADAAAEKCLYQMRIIVDGVTGCSADGGLTSVSLYGGTVTPVATRASSKITSVGQYKGTQRKVEISW